VSANAAEWFAAVGTVGAFAATSLTLWNGHRLRKGEHAEAMLDAALNVTASAGMGAEYITTQTPAGPQKLPEPRLDVWVHNKSNRWVTNITIKAEAAKTGELVGTGTAEYLQARMDLPFQFDPGDVDIFDTQVTLTFEDVGGTTWVRKPSGHLSRIPPRKWWQPTPAGPPGR
jgi:hypothetical protein